MVQGYRFHPPHDFGVTFSVSWKCPAAGQHFIPSTCWKNCSGEGGGGGSFLSASPGTGNGNPAALSYRISFPTLGGVRCDGSPSPRSRMAGLGDQQRALVAVSGWFGGKEIAWEHSARSKRKGGHDRGGRRRRRRRKRRDDLQEMRKEKAKTAAAPRPGSAPDRSEAPSPPQPPPRRSRRPLPSAAAPRIPRGRGAGRVPGAGGGGGQGRAPVPVLVGAALGRGQQWSGAGGAPRRPRNAIAPGSPAPLPHTSVRRGAAAGGGGKSNQPDRAPSLCPGQPRALFPWGRRHLQSGKR